MSTPVGPPCDTCGVYYGTHSDAHEFVATPSDEMDALYLIGMALPDVVVSVNGREARSKAEARRLVVLARGKSLTVSVKS